MDIISFFRNIDGPIYFIMLGVNTILILAIIGYLGEKNNEKFVKMSMQTPTTSNLNGAINLNVVTKPNHSDATIPTVAPTMANVPVDNNAAQQEINNNLPTNNVSGTFINNVAPVSVEQANENIVNEEVPAVLVINSENTNMPK